MTDAHVKRTLNRVAVDTDVYTLARQRTGYLMDNHDKVAVLFSGGKDSTATLNVALEEAHSDPRHARHLPLRTIFYDEEAIPQETEDYVRRTFARPDVAGEWYCLPVQHRNACSRSHPYWWPWAPEAQEKWCRPLPPEAITTLPGFTAWPPEARPTIPNISGLLAPPPHTTALLMGIRADESLIRLRAVSRKTVDNYLMADAGSASNAGNVFKAYPVYDWRTEDVWAAPRRMGWDYNRAYDLLEMAGIQASRQRCSPAFGEEPLMKIHTYAQCFPAVWARMSERVPGISAASRYALTELYAYRTRPPKPDDMTWPEWCAHYIGKFRAAEQAQVATRLRREIATHYRKTSHPIAAHSPHPLSSISWKFLFTIAMRGDFKSRKQAAARTGGVPPAELWHNYAEDLAATIADGTAAELGHPRPMPTDPYALIPDRYRTPETTP